MPDSGSERLKRIREKKAQLEKQERELLNQEKTKARKQDTRRKIIVGGIFLEYFPEYAATLPKKTNAENYEAFAPVAHLLSRVVRDKNLVEWLKSDD